jgi:hypothetical protein
MPAACHPALPLPRGGVCTTMEAGVQLGEDDNKAIDGIRDLLRAQQLVDVAHVASTSLGKSVSRRKEHPQEIFR